MLGRFVLGKSRLGTLPDSTATTLNGTAPINVSAAVAALQLGCAFIASGAINVSAAGMFAESNYPLMPWRPYGPSISISTPLVLSPEEYWQPCGDGRVVPVTPVMPVVGIPGESTYDNEIREAFVPQLRLNSIQPTHAFEFEVALVHGVPGVFTGDGEFSGVFQAQHRRNSIPATRDLWAINEVFLGGGIL